MEKLNCILLVDDDPITNFMNKALIQKLDATDEVLVATDGQQAINLFKQRTEDGSDIPRLIFLDINMPVMNGFEFLEAYQRLDKNIKQSVIIVMLTTSLNPNDIERLNRTSKADYASKPLTEKKLKAVLEKYFS